jgi:hypothetical protein
MPEREIYLLSPRALSPETIAVAFAKTSRSPESFRAIAAELSDEKSAQFHEKWVVGYGHASVAEHAVLHIAFENVSRLAIESIESNRLASYTEKSTRYQKWGTDDFTVPSELMDHFVMNISIPSGFFSRHMPSLLALCAALSLSVFRGAKTKKMKPGTAASVRNMWMCAVSFYLRPHWQMWV